MKKNFLLAIVLMLTVSLSTFAQKEYNMVITLSNGTTITLGHNDIKNITFNNGEISISGDVTTTIQNLQTKTEDMEKYANELYTRTYEMECRIMETQAYIEKVMAELAMAEQDIKVNKEEMQANVEKLRIDIEETRKRMEVNVADLIYAINTINTHDAEIVNLKAMIATLDAKVSAMQK